MLDRRWEETYTINLVTWIYKRFNDHIEEVTETHIQANWQGIIVSNAQSAGHCVNIGHLP